MNLDSFLKRFFAPPNRLTIASKPELAHWVARLSGPEPKATVLPCWRDGAIVDWYGLAFSDRELRTLAEGLTAFVGPSYSTFRGQAAELDRADPIEAAVCELVAGRAFKFRGADAREVWRALERLRCVWELEAQRLTRGSSSAAPPACCPSPTTP
jgi:hypothetical protein